MKQHILGDGGYNVCISDIPSSMISQYTLAAHCFGCEDQVLFFLFCIAVKKMLYKNKYIPVDLFAFNRKKGRPSTKKK